MCGEGEDFTRSEIRWLYQADALIELLGPFIATSNRLVGSETILPNDDLNLMSKCAENGVLRKFTSGCTAQNPTCRMYGPPCERKGKVSNEGCAVTDGGHDRGCNQRSDARDLPQSPTRIITRSDPFHFAFIWTI